MAKFAAGFINFSIQEMKERGDKIRRWANDPNNEVLAQLAQEVIEAAEART